MSSDPDSSANNIEYEITPVSGNQSLHIQPILNGLSVLVVLVLIALGIRTFMLSSHASPPRTQTSRPFVGLPISTSNWQNAGPPNSHGLAISGNDPQTLYTCQVPALASGGQVAVSVSRDGGETWIFSALPLISGIDCALSSNPTDAGDLLLEVTSCESCNAPTQLWRTRDGGAHWRLLAPPPIGSDVLATRFDTPIWAGDALFLRPTAPDSVRFRHLAVSVGDGPLVWSNLTTLFRLEPSDADIIATFASDSAFVAEVYAYNDSDCPTCHFYWRTQDGVQWTPIEFPGAPAANVTVTASSSDGRMLYGVAFSNSPNERLAISPDQGNGWVVLPALPPDAAFAQIFGITDDGTIYIACSFPGGINGIYSLGFPQNQWDFVAPFPDGGKVFTTQSGPTGMPVRIWGLAHSASPALAQLQDHAP